MTIIEMLARAHGTGGWQTLSDMIKFAEAVAKEEREACAKACENEHVGEDVNDECFPNDSDGAYNAALRHAANAIRMRK